MNKPQPLQLTDRESEAEVEGSDDSGSYTSEDIERCYSLVDCETDASRNA